MKGKSKTVVVVVATVGMLGTGFFVSQAHAGDRGQQISLCEKPNTVSSAVLRGTNQDGVPESAGASWDNISQGCTDTVGIWWKGNVTIEWMDTIGGRVVKTTTCNVPERQEGDFFVCNF